MTDLVVQTPRIPEEGETLTGNAFNMFTGGKGANQAVQAARLGAPVTMVGALGQDAFGDEHLKALQRDGINYDSVQRFGEVSSGVGNVLLEPNGNNRIVIVPGANNKLSPDYIESIKDVIEQTDILMLQLEVPIPTVKRAIKLAKAFGKTIVLNPAPAQHLDDSDLMGIDYIIPNETELRMLTRSDKGKQLSIKMAAVSLTARGVKNVIVTLGEKGSFWTNGVDEKKISATQVNPVDTTAAGDSFIGAFAYQLAVGNNIIGSLQFASVAGAITTTRLGSQPSLVTLTEVQQAMNIKII